VTSASRFGSSAVYFANMTAIAINIKKEKQLADEVFSLSLSLSLSLSRSRRIKRQLSRLRALSTLRKHDSIESCGFRIGGESLAIYELRSARATRSRF